MEKIDIAVLTTVVAVAFAVLFDMIFGSFQFTDAKMLLAIVSTAGFIWITYKVN